MKLTKAQRRFLGLLVHHSGKASPYECAYPTCSFVARLRERGLVEVIGEWPRYEADFFKITEAGRQALSR